MMHPPFCECFVLVFRPMLWSMFRPRRSNPFSLSQGLTFNDGILYESTGLYGESKVRILDANTGQATKTIMIPGNEFGEGMAYYDGNLVQITWRAKKGHVYSSNDLTKVADFTYTTSKNDEGWGITYDTERNELIVTDGSNNLIIWDPQCWKTGVCAPIRLVPCVRLNGQLAKNLNEIEFWRGRVIANVWYEDVILVIHPETGVVEKEYDMSQLWPKAQRNQGADVLNGISVSEDPDVLYVSGKQWAQIFKLKLLV
jgi:glutaminyl-peptide cyclotransferase